MTPLLQKLNRKLYIDEAVLATAPKKIEGKLEFFKVGKYLTNNELEGEYAKRGLTPADIEKLAEYDLANPEKMDRLEYVGTHWKDAKGDWCYATFFRWDDERKVYVGRGDYGWSDDCYFAGIRASNTTSLESAIKQVKEAGYVIYKII